MAAIVHRTPGLIDIRSFTTMGMSTKLGNNPIGMFGTGLKYAIAVLVRAGARPVVWIGLDRYEFYCDITEFRGKEFKLVRMKRQRPVKITSGFMDVVLGRAQHISLPFTTEYGRNWKMWMAFRELEANTRDECGETYHDTAPVERIMPQPDQTTIVVDDLEYMEAWDNQDNIFLPKGHTMREGSEGLQIIKEPSEHVYYRGMRAYDLSRPTLWTYNVLADIELTEDRTLKYEHQVKEQLARHLLGSSDEMLIQQLTTCNDDHWEHNLPFPEWVVPSEAFRRVVERKPKGMWSSVGSYYHRHDRRPVQRPEELMNKHPRPWVVKDNMVLDADGKAVFDAPYGYPGRWEPLAEELLKRLGMRAQDCDDADQAAGEGADQPSHTTEHLEVPDVIMVPKSGDIPF